MTIRCTAIPALPIGQRAIPGALERAGFRFHHNTIGEALGYATARRHHD